jgi:hypothetical protein
MEPHPVALGCDPVCGRPVIAVRVNHAMHPSQKSRYFWWWGAARLDSDPLNRHPLKKLQFGAARESSAPLGGPDIHAIFVRSSS